MEHKCLASIKHIGKRHDRECHGATVTTPSILCQYHDTANVTVVTKQGAPATAATVRTTTTNNKQQKQPQAKTTKTQRTKTPPTTKKQQFLLLSPPKGQLNQINIFTTYLPRTALQYSSLLTCTP